MSYHISYEDMYLRADQMIEIKISEKLHRKAMKVTKATDSSDMVRKCIERTINHLPLEHLDSVLDAVNRQHPRDVRVQARTARAMHNDLMESPHLTGSYNDRAKACIGWTAGLKHD